MSIRAMPIAVSLLITAGLAACEKAEQVQQPARKVSYADDVAPLMQKHCNGCHVAGQQGAVETGLLLDSYESIMKGSQYGPVIDPGSAKTSSMYILLSAQDNLTVNMPHGMDPLSAEEIETIRAWIDYGAIEN